VALPPWGWLTFAFALVAAAIVPVPGHETVAALVIVVVDAAPEALRFRFDFGEAVVDGVECPQDFQRSPKEANQAPHPTSLTGPFIGSAFYARSIFVFHIVRPRSAARW